MRRRRSSRPSCSIRALTLTAATSVKMTPVGAAVVAGVDSVCASVVTWVTPCGPDGSAVMTNANSPSGDSQSGRRRSPAPLRGRPGGDLAQPAGGLGQRLLHRPEVLHQRVQRADP